MSLVDVLMVCFIILVISNFASIAVAARRSKRPEFHPPYDGVGVTILKPVCGLENNIARTLQSAFDIRYPRYELIFCVASPADPIVPIVEELIALHSSIDARLLVGDDRISSNPKLNNVAKGWNAAKYNWIIFSDSNVLVPPDYIDRFRACWDAETAFVCSPPVGIDAKGFGAALEAAFLNTYQARWQLVADALGMGFVQGKSIFLRRSDLECEGGLRALGAEAAEDAAATKIARRRGKKVRVVGRPFAQPLGHRSLADVWCRQVRWARLRRSSFPGPYLAEILSGALPATVLYSILAGMDTAPWMGLPVMIASWYAAEAMLAIACSWPLTLNAPLAWLARDLLMPLIWLQGWYGQDFTWRGTEMTAARPVSPRQRL